MISLRSSGERRLRSWRRRWKNFAGSPELPHSSLLADRPGGSAGGLGRGFSIVKKLVHGNFESAGHFFECLDTRDGVAVFDTRDVAALETGALLNVPLRKPFLLPDG